MGVSYPSTQKKRQAVVCRWVYAIKGNPNGKVDHQKEPLVAKWHTTKIYGQLYSYTFPPNRSSSLT